MADIPLLKAFPGSLHRFLKIMKIPKDEPTAKCGDPIIRFEIAALVLFPYSYSGKQTGGGAMRFQSGRRHPAARTVIS
jgi:hypothetical protein